MQYSESMRKTISEQAKGKIIESLEWVENDGGYWVMTFTDGSEISIRLMAEISERTIMNKVYAFGIATVPEYRPPTGPMEIILSCGFVSADSVEEARIKMSHIAKLGIPPGYNEPMIAITDPEDGVVDDLESTEIYYKLELQNKKME